MKAQRTAATPGITVRFARAGLRDRVNDVARLERRSASSYIEELVERDMHARDEASRVIRVHVSPGLAGVPEGEVTRREGEGDEEYGRRKATLDALMGR